jgi:hypothetical protein
MTQRTFMTLRAQMILLILCAVLAVGCESPNTPQPVITLDQPLVAEDYFTFRLPGNMNGACGYGVDTYVGWYEGPGLKMWFDFGPSSMVGSVGSFHREHPTTYQSSISGRYCEIAMEYNPGQDSLRPYANYMMCPDVSDSLHWVLHLGFYGRTEGSVDTAIAVIRSIRFTL